MLRSPSRPLAVALCLVALDPRYERWLTPGLARSQRLAVDLFRVSGGGKKPVASPLPAYSGSRSAPLGSAAR